MGTFRNNHNPTSPSTFQDLLYFQFPSVRLIPVIQPMPLPCTTYQISADHICTINHCSLWMAKGQDLQKVLSRAGQTHCPSATTDKLYLHDSTINYISDAHGSAGNLAEPQQFASPQNIVCCHSSEGLQHFRRGFCFSKCLKCVTHGKTMPWSCCCTCMLLGAWWLSSWKAESWSTSSFFFPGIFQSSLGLNLSTDLLTPWSGTDFYSNKYRRNKCMLVL